MAQASRPAGKPVDHFEWAHAQKDIVWMSQNTNTIPTTPRIDEAIQDAVKRGIHHLYPLQKGYPGLSDLVRNDLGLDAEWNVMLAHGGLEALYAMNRSLFAKGDEVVCTDPSFLPIHNQMKLAGTVPVEISIYDAPWKASAQRFQQAITPRTKAILLIDPINPLGTAYTRDEVRAVAQIAKDRNLVLIHDVTYRDFSDHQTLASEFYPEGTIIVYSFSKNCGLAGMRVGALLAQNPLWDRIKPFTVSTLGINVLSQVAAKAALETKKDWMPNVKEISRRNQATIKDAVAKTEGCFLPVYPSHANLFCVDINATGLDQARVEEHLLFKHKVFVRSGKYVSPAFGSRFVRISFSVSEQDCARFAEAWPQAIAELRKRL